MLLRIHYRKHSGEDIICLHMSDLQEESFLMGGHRFHTGEKPYIQCGKLFFQASNMKSHVSVKTFENCCSFVS